MKKNYRDSDYTVNKNADGIVYAFADQTVEVTLEDYLLENPGNTAADFAELKALSDADYYETDRSDYRQTWKNMSFDRLTEKELDALCTPSAEQSVIEQGADEAVYTEMRSSAARALAKLTEIQRRRYLMYHAHGMTSREIAEIECVDHKAILNSIWAAEKKIKKFFSAD